MRTIGTVVRGVRAPIIRKGDNIAEIAAASVMEAWKEADIEPRDRDVVAVTESVVARAQGNYASLDQIAADVRAKTGGGTVGVAFPILSRNRFSLLLRGMAMGCSSSARKGGNIGNRRCYRGFRLALAPEMKVSFEATLTQAAQLPQLGMEELIQMRVELEERLGVSAAAPVACPMTFLPSESYMVMVALSVVSAAWYSGRKKNCPPSRSGRIWT